jgi:hypothetical protein
MNEINQINQKVIELWQRTFNDDENVFMPLLYSPIKRNILLFVGLNPSFSQKGFQIVLKDTPYSHINPGYFFHWHNRVMFDLETAQEIERLAKKRHPYFAKFEKIAEYTGMDWEHVDLFFFRETSQKILKTRVYGVDGINEFGRSQLKLSREIIEETHPKMIVVANAFASKIFSEEFKAQFDEEQGYHTINLNGQVVPVFLGSTLTGQRAMDVYSYQRLRWHIKKAIEHFNHFND